MTDIVEELLAEHARNGGQGAYAWRARELCGKAATEIERLRANVKRVQTAARALDATRAEIYDHYRQATVINTEAVATLDSERDANAILTDEIEALRKHAEAMAGALGEIMALPGEINPSNYDHDDVCELNRQFVYGYEIARIPLAAYRADYPEEK